MSLPADTPLGQGPTTPELEEATLPPPARPKRSGEESQETKPKRSAQAWALLIADFVRDELRAGKRLPFPLSIPPQTYGMSVRLLQEVGMASAQREAEAQGRGEPALPRWSLRPSFREIGNSAPHITFTADLHKSLRGRTSPELWSLATGLYGAPSTALPPKAVSPGMGTGKENCEAPAAAAEHELYQTGDSDAPFTTLDRNYKVVVSQCRVCGQVEGDLAPCCPGKKAAPSPAEHPFASLPPGVAALELREDNIGTLEGLLSDWIGGER